MANTLTNCSMVMEKTSLEVSQVRQVRHKDRKNDAGNGRESGKTVPDSGQQLDSGTSFSPRFQKGKVPGPGGPGVMGTDGGETWRFEPYVTASGFRSLHIRP